jgi:TolA-binding protein
MNRLDRLGQQLRQDLSRHEDVDKVTEARARRQALARVGHGKRRQRLGVAFGAAALAAAAALIFVWYPSRADTPLSFWIEDRSGHVDEWVTARDVERSLRFSDGSSVVAGPHTTTRVMQVTPAGARLTLERGRIDAHVVPREASRWQVAAGPFVVHVTGTRFRVVWDPHAEKIAVSVSEGRVEVTGGGQPRHQLTAGSSLELSAPDRVKSAPSAQVEPPSSSVDAVASANARDEEELIRPRKAEGRKADFRELSTAGRYREALAVVEQAGFAAECESLGAKDLLTLGSTARLAGRTDRAREAYLAARRRFPKSSEAGISAFSLGRLASDAGQTRDAIGWFTRYLTEQPSGQLAREAAGRLMELYRQAGQHEQARAAASDYLKRFPTGPHAPLARSMLDHP